MQITGTEGYLPIQKKTTRPASLAGTGRRQVQDGYYDHITVSVPAEQDGRSFRELAASLAHQVRTHNTTGKIQELRRQVSTGEYRVDARETASRMLLLSGEGE